MIADRRARGTPARSGVSLCHAWLLRSPVLIFVSIRACRLYTTFGRIDRTGECLQKGKGMKTTVVLVTLGFMLPCMGNAQDNGQSAPQGVKFEFGATLNSVLSDTVDARRCKPGDPVKAKTSEDVKAGGIVVIPRGAKLIGHVTEAQPAAKAGDQARLGLLFDRADLKDGRQIPLHTTFYALAAPEGASS